MTQEEALTILKTGANVFLTGAAGSGKTHTLRAYIDYLRTQHVGVAITASTGIAATHMGGMTIHAWSGIGIKSHLSSEEFEAMSEKQYIARRMDATDVLIIDEISMLHHYRLDLVDQVLRVMRRVDMPFGGMQVVLCGDFFQLPPVSRAGQTPGKFAYHATAWHELAPVVCYLEEQHRQNDTEYTGILNAIRDNDVTEDILGTLWTRYKTPPDITIEPTKLYTHNADVDDENERELKKLPGKSYEYRMVSRGRDALVDVLKKSCLAPEALRLKVGARVMFVKNNFEAGYANGTLGVVESCDEHTIVVRSALGKRIEVQPESWHIEDGGKKLAELSQYPLRLAWAITIHKSQGMSLDAAEIDLSQSFEPGMGYVALSRLRTLSGLSLKGMNNRALAVHDEVLEKDAEFRRASKEHAHDIGAWTKEDVHARHALFLSRVARPDPEEKKDTYNETALLFQMGHSIHDIAEMRELTVGTILNHLETLKERDREFDCSRIRHDFAPTRLKKIMAAFTKIGVEEGGVRPLSPVKAILGDRFSFEEIRMARLLLK